MTIVMNRRKFIQQLKERVASCPPGVPVYEVITHLCEKGNIDLDSVAKIIRNDEFLRSAVHKSAVENKMLKSDGQS